MPEKGGMGRSTQSASTVQMRPRSSDGIRIHHFMRSPRPVRRGLSTLGLALLEDAGRAEDEDEYQQAEGDNVLPLVGKVDADGSRGRGIARQLIEAVYAQARAAGSPRVYWQTHETNQTAMRLYDQVAEKSGFLVYRKML